jgi:putative addiction module component (TIGR02574 family)
MATDATPLSIEAEQVFIAAMRLADDERARVVDKLLDSVESCADPNWEAAWSTEISRRISEVENGTAKLHTWDELQQMMRDARDAARKS